MKDNHLSPSEGDLFMTVAVGGYTFDLRYGYYEDSDRSLGEPVPIYPDLKKHPLYSRDGFPIVTAVQSPCEYYTVKKDEAREDCCCDCIYYPSMKDEIGICRCRARQLMIPTESQYAQTESNETDI
ncbi:MAG: hypothetical protein J6D45_04065 [Clostridia bacterium]|nr:hypothetical protein [Clostridia bacterium]